MQALARPKDFAYAPVAAEDVVSAREVEETIAPARPSPASPPICNRSRRLMPSHRVRRVPRIRSIGRSIQRRGGCSTSDLGYRDDLSFLLLQLSLQDSFGFFQ